MAATAFNKITNNASGTLDSSITDSDTSIPLSSGDGAELPSSGAFWVNIRALGSDPQTGEILHIASRSTDTLTADVRGDQSTSATAHDAGAVVELLWTAEQVTELQSAVNAIEDGSKTLTTVTTSGDFTLGGDLIGGTTFDIGPSGQPGLLGLVSGALTVNGLINMSGGNFNCSATTQWQLSHQPASGVALIRFSPIDVSDAGAQVDFFRSTNSSGFRAMTLYPGDGTANAQFVWRVGSTNPHFTCSTSSGTETFIVNSETGKVVITTVATAAGPSLKMEQLDVSEEFFEFAGAIGTGNAIEVVAAKAITHTHFIKVTLTGGLTRYIPVGTIA